VIKTNVWFTFISLKARPINLGWSRPKINFDVFMAGLAVQGILFQNFVSNRGENLHLNHQRQFLQ